MTEHAQTGQPETTPSAPGPDLHPTPVLLPSGSPDWNSIHFDVLCSRCGYDLRGLADPRCPECGLDFSWPDVLHRATHRRVFLFEHHWRDRPVRSWAASVWRGFRPKRFWRSVSIHDDIVAGPLWLMILLSVVASMTLLYMLSVGLGTGAMYVSRHVPQGSPVNQACWTLATAWGGMFVTNFFEPALLLLMFSSFLGPQILTLGILLSLRQTMARCRVRPVQILRVVAYASTPMCLTVSVTLIATLVIESVTSAIGSVQTSTGPWLQLQWIAGMIGSAAIVMWGALPLIVPAVHLGAGLKRYLRLPHAAGVAIATAGIMYLSLGVAWAAIAILSSNFR